MDSLTQAALGANVFAAFQYPHMGRRSLWIGAALGTLPDLDVLLSPLLSELGAISFHRSISHSLVFCLAVAGGFALWQRWKGRTQTVQRRWLLSVFLTLFTHALLDWCTTYGTKLLAPFNDHLFALNIVHVFEPVYTLILLVPLVYLLVKGRHGQRPMKWLVAGLLVSTGYLGWAFINKQHACSHFRMALDAAGMENAHLRAMPTPWNTLLWHGVAISENSFGFATYKFGDRTDIPVFEFVPHDAEALQSLPHTESIERYLHYTQGLTLCQTGEDGMIRLYAVKFGPTNYCGKPEFVYPLVIDPAHPEQAHIAPEDGFFGPTAHLDQLLDRLVDATPCAR